MDNFLQSLLDLLLALFAILYQLGGLILTWALLLVWIAWCLWGINWHRLGGYLKQGAWAPLVLLMLMIAAMWSWMLPTDAVLLGAVTIPNFWWQLLTVGLVVGIGFFCGWIQGWRHWQPPEIELHPARGGDAHGDGHGHGHH